ncbi:hypothetical protein Despr_1411 [Desulfobulbus propionicus DSM 2032]|uniref:Uncharacterized protein n=1 Tax=Desulfobulbus propionicus (strain ATCC 33891 / DSM 2032 / VKM B-1956 / 1pr3) TaxID=577650 RepID=A0A7U3YLT1_DESPD|nr:hypothetical protein [Desulfobulbus propionicus]ADW17573.1 hypothetical protein Despr_1411 [Desulfobulbus propionicus DSM 2032]
MQKKAVILPLALSTILVLTALNTACLAAPRLDVSKSPPERTQLTPEEIEKNKKRQEKIEKDLEELDKEHKLEHDQNNQPQKKTGRRAASLQP